MSSSEFQKWKESGMIYNRYRAVVSHLELMERAQGELDITTIRGILVELIKSAKPVEDYELEVISKIRKESP